MTRTPVKYSWSYQNLPVFWLETASDRQLSGVSEVLQGVSRGADRILDRCSSHPLLGGVYRVAGPSSLAGRGFMVDAISRSLSGAASHARGYMVAAL